MNIQSGDEILDSLRALAKKPYYQAFFAQAKDLSLRIFENDRDLTFYQIIFLNYLSMYNNLSLDVYLGEVPEIVTDNFIYEDAYLHYKKESRRQETAKSKEKIKKKDTSASDNIGKFSWNFKTKKP